MRAVVLVGGFGTRLRPLTLQRPKQMLPVVDRPMIEWVAGWLGANGVQQMVLSLGYRPEAFTEAYPDGRCAGVELVYAVEPEPLDTAGAIRFAALHAGLDHHREPFLVVNGDVITDLAVGDLVALHRARAAEATIALTPVEDPSRYGVVATAPDGKVTAFVEKPAPGTEPSTFINAGTYVLEPSVLARIPDGRRVSIERETFPAMVADGTLYALASDAAWVDAGTPATYLAVQLQLARKLDPMGAGVEVDGTATVTGSVLRAGVRVGPNCQVSGSVIGAGSVIDAGAVIEGSLIGDGAHIGAGARLVGLCVVGDGETIPVGARLEAARVPTPR
ncbi:MAG: sugar phosphate nucleotidyltransferase [Acidimicrobiales bacterium]